MKVDETTGNFDWDGEKFAVQIIVKIVKVN